MINIGKSCTNKEKSLSKKLLTKFHDVFAWGYGDLKKFYGW